MAISPVSHEPDGLERVWKIGATVPRSIQDCIHNLVARTVARQPGAPAVCAWDGELTYAELNELASKLAHQLVNLGIGSGDIVPLLFEKSMWTAVAILGVVAAGAGFVLLDHFLPEERLKVIVQQAQSNLILTSLLNRDLCSRLSQMTVLVGPALAKGDKPVLPQSHPAPHPSSVVYVIFTSGSTGVPKGCVVSHENLCSALHHQMPSLGFKPTSRVFDFASYSFDTTIYNIFAALLIGGCLCIPSDADRKDNLGMTITRMNATFIGLTPTVARLLNPEVVPTLNTLVLLGEIVTEYDSKAWWAKTQLVNGYGPAECTPFSTINSTASTPAMLCSIGIGMGAVTWIVDPQNHNILLPWGQIGELLVEGPVVGLGYLNDPEKTAEVFIEDPTWLVQGGFGVPGRRGRLYKTGDLVRYAEDGNIIILGRKDTQIKIRGNRVELGEVECRVQDCMPEATQVVAEAVLPVGSKVDHVLAAFLQIPGTTPILNDSGLAPLGTKLLNISKEVEAELAKHLPAYMIPTLFFTIPQLPLTLTGKADRKLLREIGASFSVEQVALQMAEQGSKKPPRTQAEKELQNLWARTFNVDSNNIGVDDSFFRLGGDSITAMKLVGEARKIGIKLTVADIFQQPILKDLSRRNSGGLGQLPEELSTANLLDPSLKAAFLAEIDSSDVVLRAEDVVDILPLTDTQESLVVEGLSENLQFVDYYYLDLGLKVDLAKFKESCSQLLEAFPILRASFWPFDRKYWMVIPKNLDVPFHVTDVDSDLQDALADFCLRDISTFKRKQPIITFVLLRNKTQGIRLIVRLSHAQYDGISIELIFKALIGAYHGQKIPELTSFSAYVAYISRQRPRSLSYFQKLLKDAKYTDFGTHFLPQTILGSIPVFFRIENEIPFPKTPTGITTASFMSAAWAVYLSQFLKEDDVVYGQLVNGRNASIPGVEEIIGCCINIVPVRVNLALYTSTTELVRSVQSQFIALGEADSLGFTDAIENCTEWPPGSKIYSCSIYQNIDEDLVFEIGDERFRCRLCQFENHRRLPYFLYVISLPRGDKLGVQVVTHSHMMTIEKAQALLNSFCPLVEKLAADLNSSASIKDV